jgi:complex iron-sulfur molybdoenzyme family reductase subunit alpha
MTTSRRDALKNLFALGATAVASTAVRAESPPTSPPSLPVPERRDDPRTAPPPKTSTEDMYRAEFAASHGDSGEHGFAYHCVNCQGNCAWQVWSKDGRVTRENQSASYPAIADDIPDANPRGCNKGVQHSQTMYEADRLLHPLKRVGARGEGKWKRISWDEAITEVATHLYESMRTKGPAANYVHIGAGVLTEARAASVKRLGALLGAVRPYIASYVGDMFPGVSAVYGEGNVGCTYDFLYKSNVAVFWGCNPNTSRIPDAHYLWEGKYNGSKVIVITPEFNSTAIHADLWVPVKPGADGHLALAICKRIIDKRLFDERFLVEKTDLPLLVDDDTGQLLRVEDIDEGAFDPALLAAFAADHDKRHEVFVAFDKKSNRLIPLPGAEGSSVDSLRLRDAEWDLDPVLDKKTTVKRKDGRTTKASTVFVRFVAELAKFAPEKVQALTGVHPSIVDELAVDLAKSQVAVLTLGFSIGKHFNGMLSQRAIAALAALSGKLGDKGGINTENEWNITGLAGLSGFDGRYLHRFESGMTSEFVLGDGLRDYDRAFGDEDVQRATGLTKSAYKDRVVAMLQSGRNDEGYKNGKPYWDTCETFLLFADARFRRNKGSYKDAFLQAAKFIAYGDIRMSDFAQYADVLLPCTSHYEAWDIRTNPGYHRFANIAVPPQHLKPVGETKSEWEISALIAAKVEQLARARHATTKNDADLKIKDPTHTTTGFRDLATFTEEFTLGGKIKTDKDAVEYALEHVDQFKPNTVQTIYDRGGFLTLGENAGKSSPLYKNKPYNTFEAQQYLHQRFDTLTGRLTFYVDHPLWIEAGAAVVTARESIRPRKYPFALMTPHARWSIHSTYKTSPTLLRLQRGKPYVMINPDVAAARGIADGDDVRMKNDLGDAVLMAKIVAGVPPDAVVMEHGWEPFMYRGRKGHNALVGDMLNLLELSDGWGHLKFGTNWDGNQHAYDATVDLEKVS